MQALKISYKRHRFPPQIIAHVGWLYARFNLSLREVEELMLERGVDVSYETRSSHTGSGSPSINTVSFLRKSFNRGETSAPQSGF